MIKKLRVFMLFFAVFFVLFPLRNFSFAETPITYGQTIDGSISAAGEKDGFTFSGTTGDKITIRFANAGVFTPYVELFSPAGSLIAYSWLGEINAALSITGTFKITICDYENTGTGAYSLGIQRVNNPAGAVALSFGQTVTGNIDSFVKIVSYSFSANANDVVTIRTGITSNPLETFDPYLELYDQTGTLIKSVYNVVLTQKVSSAGTYYLLVTDSNRDGTGAYSLGIQRVNNPVGAVALSFGQTVTGSIDSFAGIVSYSFSANANDVVTVCTGITANPLGTFDPYLELYDQAGTLIKSVYNGVITQKVSSAGTYYLLVTDYNRDGTGAYSLGIQRVNNPAGAVALSFGQTVTGNIDSFVKIVSYSFSANANDVVTIRTGITSNPLETFDPYLELYDQTGTLIKSVYNGVITQKVSSAGTYYLLVTDSNRDGTGAYSLGIQRVNNPAGAVALSFGQTVTDSIDSFAGIVSYSFSANANDMVTIRVGAASNLLGTFEPYLELYDQSGILITSIYDGIFTQKVSSAGTYYLLVTDYNRDGTGTYSLGIQRVNNPSGAAALSFGQIVTGNIDTFAKIITYSFSANANDVVTIRTGITSNPLETFDPYLELYDQAGTLIKSVYNGVITQKVSSAGTYYLLVTDYNRDGTGAYSLGIQRVNNPAGAIALSFGQTVSGSIDSFVGIVSYTLTVTANDKILIPFTLLNQTAGSFEPYLELYDPAGALIISKVTGRVEVTAAATGVYYILVTDLYRSGTGTYELTLQRANNPVNLKDAGYDTIIEDSLSAFTQFNAYKISAQAQDKITFCSAVNQVSAGQFDIKVELFNSGGERLVFGYVNLKHTFLSSGTFYLFVSDNEYNGRGAYKFTVKKSDISCGTLDLNNPEVVLDAPKADEIVKNGTSYNILWYSWDNVGIIGQEIRLSTDRGVTYPTVIAADLTEYDRSYAWSIPSTLTSSSARIKVIARDAAGNEGYDTTKSDFIIADTNLPLGSMDVVYQYDKSNRLINTAYGTKNITYIYDAVGNRLNLNVE